MNMTIYAPTEITAPDISADMIRITVLPSPMLFIPEESDALPGISWYELLEAFKELPRAEDL